MSAISSVNAAAAMLFLQQASVSAATPGKKSDPGAELIAAANKVSNPGPADAARPSQQASGKATDSLFDRSQIDVTEMKTRLFERLGKELGLAPDDFETAADFGRAVEDAVNQLKWQEDGFLKLMEIESDLGLDKLGISIDTLVDAMVDPDGDADDRLEEALLREVGEDDDMEAAERLRAFTLDDIGVYGF